MKKFVFIAGLLSLVCLGLFFQRPSPKKPLRFFNLDLHISVIADVKHLFEEMGHEVTQWSISGSTWVFGKKPDQVDIVNQNTWGALSPEMCDAFYERYKDFLSQFDAFIVTHTPAFALLYEKCNKPIIVINSTRYENPFTNDPERWHWLNCKLREGVAKGKIFLVSNNKADQAYLKFHTDLDSELIPNLCLYTKARSTRKKKGFIVNALWGQEFDKVVSSVLSDRELIQNDNLKRPYKWRALYSYQGIVHFPYQVSTMSLFEQYSANIPLFFPTKRFLKELHDTYPETILSQLSFYKVRHAPLPPLAGDPNNVQDPAVLEKWIDLADFYDTEAMPHLQYFDAFAELEHLLQRSNCTAISRKMRAHNRKRKERVLRQWEQLLDAIKMKRPADSLDTSEWSLKDQQIELCAASIPAPF